MEKVKVLVITTVDLGFNGVTSVIMNYYRNIDRNSISFDFISGRKVQEEIRSEIEGLGGQIYDVPSRDKKPLSYVKAVKNIIRNNKYKIVHIHGNSGTVYLDVHIAKIEKVPVRIVHSHNSTCSHKIIHKLLKPLLNREMTHGFACSELAGNWLFNKKYTVLNNGIDIEKFIFNNNLRDEYRKKLNLENKFILGHIGHFSYQKNHNYLLDVFNEVHKKNNNAHLVLVGDGKLRSEIEKKIEDLHLKDCVTLLGKRSDASKIINVFDVFIFPSRFEGLPVVLIEAQANGLSCIVSDTVTKECKISQKVSFIPLDMDKSKWIEEILKYNDIYDRKKDLDLIRNSKFNIKKETKKLENFYLSFQ